jgi:hypothetical protein
MDSITRYGFQRAIMDLAGAALGTWDLGLAKLTKALVPVSKTMLLASFDDAEASFTGYAAVAQAWGLSYRGQDLAVRLPGVLSAYVPTGSVDPNTIRNVYVTNAAEDTLIAAGTVTPGLNLVGVDDAAQIVPQVCWGNPTLKGPMSVDLMTTAHMDRLTLDAARAMTGPLNASKPHLLKAPVGLTPDTTIAQLNAQQADYDGYAAQTSVWTLAAYLGADGRARVTSIDRLFKPNAAVTANTIYGYYETVTDGSQWLFARLLDIPVTLQGTDTGLILASELIYGT